MNERLTAVHAKLDLVKIPLRPLLLAGLLLATALIVISQPPREAQAALEWKGCGGNFECARLSVPLNYDAPSGKQIELALIRQKAKDPSQRIGSLLVNPGGPGGGGIDFTRYWLHRARHTRRLWWQDRHCRRHCRRDGSGRVQ